MGISLNHQIDQISSDNTIIIQGDVGGFVVARGNNTSERPSTTGNNGLIRYNTTNNKLEAVINGAYVNLSTSADITSYLYKTGDSMTGVLGIVAGTAALPGISFAANTSTGIYQPGVGVMGFSTAGVERMRIDASGNVTTTTQAISDSSTKLATTAFVGSYANGTALTLITGTTAVTQAAGDATSKLATTAFVNNTALTLANGTTAVTQSAGDNTTKVASTAFVNSTALTLANGTTATTQSISDNTTKVATTAFVGSYANGTALTLANGTTAVTQTAGDNTTKVATTAFTQTSSARITSSNVGISTFSCPTGWKSHTITLTETRNIFAIFTGIWGTIGNSDSYAQMYIDGVPIPGAASVINAAAGGDQVTTNCVIQTVITSKPAGTYTISVYFANNGGASIRTDAGALTLLSFV